MAESSTREEYNTRLEDVRVEMNSTFRVIIDELQNQVKVLSIALKEQSIKYHEVEQQMETTIHEKSEVELLYKDVTLRFEQAEEAIRNHHQDLLELRKRLQDKDHQIETLGGEKTKYIETCTEAQGRIAKLEAEITQALLSKNKAERQVEDFKTNLEQEKAQRERQLEFMTKIQQSYKEKCEELEKLGKENAEIRKRATDAEREVMQIRANLAEKDRELKATSAAQSEDMASLKRQNTILESELARVKSRNERLEEQTESDRNDFEDLMKELEHLKQDVAEKELANEASHVQLQTQLEQSRKDLEQEKEVNSRLRAELDQANQNLALGMNISSTTAAYDSLKQLGFSTVVDLMRAYSNMEGKLAESSQRTAELDSTLQRVLADLKAYKPALDSRQEQLERAINDNTQLNEELRNVQKALRLAHDKVFTYETKIEELTREVKRLKTEKQESVETTLSLLQQIQSQGGTGTSSTMHMGEVTSSEAFETIFEKNLQLKSENENLSERIKTLENEVQSVRNAINENTVLQAQCERLKAELSTLRSQSPQGVTSQELQSVETPLPSAAPSQSLQTYKIAYVTTKQQLRDVIAERDKLDQKVHSLMDEKNRVPMLQFEIEHLKKQLVTQTEQSTRDVEWHQKRFSEMEAIANEHKATVKRLTDAENLLRTENQELHKQLNNLQSVLFERAPRREDLQSALDQAKADITIANNKIASLEQQNQELSTKGQSLEEKLRLTSDKLDVALVLQEELKAKAREEPERLNKKLYEQETRINQVLQKETELQQKLDASQLTITELQREKSELQQTIKTLGDTISDYSFKVQQYEASDQGRNIAVLQERLNKARGHIERANQSVETWQATAKEKELQAEAACKQRDEVQAKYETVSAELSQKITEADTLKSSVERLQAELNAKSEELNNDRNKWTLQEQDMNQALEKSRQQETRLLEELEQYKNQLRAVEESKQAVQLEHASAVQQGHELANKCSQLEQQLEQLQAQSRVDTERWNNNKVALEQQMALLKQQYQALKSEAELLHKSLQDAQTSTTAESETPNVLVQLTDHLRREHDTANERIIDLNLELERHKAQYDSLQERYEALRKYNEDRENMFVKVETDLQSVNERYAEAERKLQELTVQHENAVTTLNEVRETAKEKDAEKHRIEQAIESVRLDLNIAKEELRVANEQKDAYKARLQSLLATGKVTDPAEVEKLRTDLKAVTEERDKYRTAYGNHREQMKTFGPQFKQARQDKAKAVQERDEAMKKVEELEKRATAAENKVKNFEKLYKAYEALKNRHEKINSENTDLKTRLEKENAENTSLKNRLENTEARQATGQVKNETPAPEIAEYMVKIDELVKKGSELENEIENEKKKSSGLELSLNAKTIDWQDLEKKYNELNKEIEALRDENDKLKEDESNKSKEQLLLENARLETANETLLRENARKSMLEFKLRSAQTELSAVKAELEFVRRSSNGRGDSVGSHLS